MKPSQEHYDIAKALSAALEPLIDVCLKMGVTSPEIESLLRVTFVQRAIQKLPRHDRTGRGPSDVRVSLAAGVHRTEVGRIRAAGGAASAKTKMEQKERLYSRSARVLRGWSTDPKFMTSGGHPLDLPMERNRERRSFEDLVAKYAAGNFPASVLKELRRRGNVAVQDDGIVRFKSATPRASGVTKANVARAATRMKRLGEALFQNITESEQSLLYAETKPLQLTAEQLALFRAVLERRTKTFIDALESEFRARSTTGVKDEAKRMGVSVYSWKEEE